MINRRDFLEGTALGLASLWPKAPALASVLSTSTIEILLNEPLGVISPDLYGYLVENLGTVIYDGIWVGEDSKIPNVGGIRKELIDRMRRIKPSVVRWPGGNFADYYDWKDGIGAPHNRPTRTNPWIEEMPADVSSGPQTFDPNAFGTPEFMRLCQLSGGRPFLNANVRSLVAQDFDRWVEYCNSPVGSTSLADQRKADGSSDPYRVRFWGIGNEVWDWGGRMTAVEYATIYKRFTAHVPHYGVDLAFVACGGPPPGTDTAWIREFLSICKKTMAPVPIGAMSIHYYATNVLEDLLQPGQTIEELAAAHSDWTKDDWLKLTPGAVDFDASDWYDVLAKSAKVDTVIATSWTAMEEFDPRREIKLAVDEWGIFCRPGTQLNPRDIRGRAVTLRDAMAAALTLDIFHQHADKLLLACFTGLINQEGGLFRAEGPKFVATPIFHVFELYSAHQGRQSLRTIFDSAKISHEHAGRKISLAGLSGSASIRDREVILTVVNPHVSDPVDASIVLRDGEVRGGTVATITHSDIHAQNTFEDPERVKPVIAALRAEGSSFSYRFPPASVSRFTFSLRGA